MPRIGIGSLPAVVAHRCEAKGLGPARSSRDNGEAGAGEWGSVRRGDVGQLDVLSVSECASSALGMQIGNGVG